MCRCITTTSDKYSHPASPCFAVTLILPLAPVRFQDKSSPEPFAFRAICFTKGLEISSSTCQCSSQCNAVHMLLMQCSSLQCSACHRAPHCSTQQQHIWAPVSLISVLANHSCHLRACRVERSKRWQTVSREPSTRVCQPTLRRHFPRT